MRSLVFVLVFAVGLSAQTQTPPPVRITETVVVSARDARVIADAISQLRKSRDPLVADTVADHIVALTDAMVASRRVNQIGPLSPDEQGVIDLREFVEKYAFPGGPIFVRPRNADSTPGPRLYNFTQSAFIAMCADIASSPLVQLRVRQESKMIVVSRMIADLNDQMGEVITERATLQGALAGFKEQDLEGKIIGRVQGIADALAVNADDNAPYDLVAASEQDDFRAIGHMEKGVFEVVPKPVILAVNVAYEGKVYSTTVNHFVWFFIRFLLADQDALDPGVRLRRTRLGSKLLDHLSAQLEHRVLESVLGAVNAAQPAAKGLVLGDFFARGPGLDALKKAPGLSQQDSALGSDYRTLLVSAKDMSSLPKLRDWLASELRK